VIAAPIASVPRHVLLTTDYLDESVPNESQVALARAIGASPVTLHDGGSPDLSLWPDGTAVMPPLVGNAPGGVTAGFVQFQSATHGMMYFREASRRYDLSQPFPYPLLPTPVPIDNPIDRVHAIVVDFLDQYAKGLTPTVRDPPL
jgi:hypothetical protein